MFDVTKNDLIVVTQEDEIITLFEEDGEIILTLACEVERAGVVDHVEVRAMDKNQLAALIEALNKAKEALEDD